MKIKKKIFVKLLFKPKKIFFWKSTFFFKEIWKKKFLSVVPKSLGT